MAARMPSASVQQKSQTLCRIDIALFPLPNNSSSQVGMEEFYKISRLQATSRELTLSAFKARGIISKLNLHDLSHLGRLMKQPEKLEEKGGKMDWRVFLSSVVKWTTQTTEIGLAVGPQTKLFRNSEVFNILLSKCNISGQRPICYHG